MKLALADSTPTTVNVGTIPISYNCEVVFGFSWSWKNYFYNGIAITILFLLVYKDLRLVKSYILNNSSILE